MLKRPETPPDTPQHVQIAAQQLDQNNQILESPQARCSPDLPQQVHLYPLHFHIPAPPIPIPAPVTAAIIAAHDDLLLFILALLLLLLVL